MKKSIYCLPLLLVFITSCNGQAKIDPPQAVINQQTPIEGDHPKIVRTLGTKSEVVHCELLDKDGNLWFSIIGEGVYRYDGKSFTNFTIKDGLCNNNIDAIIQDKSGNILFGTNRGICKYDGNKFTNIPMTDTLSISCFLEDKDGNLWFGAIGNGVYRYDGTKLSNFIYKYEHPFFGEKHEKYICDIIQDKSGSIWFSSWNGGGVWKYDGKIFKHFLPSIDYYKTNQDKRRSGNTQNSLDFIPNNNSFIPSQDYISDDMIFSMMEDKEGNIWFATRDHGACRYDGKIFTDFGTKEGFLSRGAYAILEDKKGNLWFTTEKDGVWRYDGKTIKNFNEKDGLVNNAVMNVLEDKEGNLWFGTKWFGLSRYDGKTFTTFSQYDN
ncbi:MAG: two-component regulator propeller domain-containing protein [Bacteroidota bacterium]